MTGKNRIHIKNSLEIEQIRNSALILERTLAEVSAHIRPGIKTKKLDVIAEDFVRSNGAIPSFKGYNGFPASLCVSINEAIVHGIPGEREIREEDIISIDCGVTFNGWVSDSAYTFSMKGVSEEAKKLLKVTKTSLYLGIQKCEVGQRIGDIGAEIQRYCESFSYGVVREFCGHGLGEKMHEKPDVPNYGKKGVGIKLQDGMVIAIEPMITMGAKDIVVEDDKWSCRTVDRSFAAHFEHDVAITTNGPDILSSFTMIEDAIEKNHNLELI